MGHKVNPISLRLQLNKQWQSKWYADKKDYRKYLAEDVAVRRHITEKFDRRAAIERIEIERTPNLITIAILTAKPGVVIGRGGTGIDELKASLHKLLKMPVRVNIEEVKKPELRAQLVADNVASQLERRISFRRAIKSTTDSVMRAGADGVRIVVSGRLNGAEMARTEKEVLGSIPLHTLRADIDYAFSRAVTTYGAIGVKVWIYKKDVV